MKKNQMSFVVQISGRKDNTDELNKLLNDGWSVTLLTEMSGNDSLTSYALVILEKES